jgi:hypothetical protein
VTVAAPAGEAAAPSAMSAAIRAADRGGGLP